MANSWFSRNDTNNEGDGKPKPFELSDEHLDKISTETSKKLETSLTERLSEMLGSALENNPVLKRVKAGFDADEQRRQQQQQQQQQTANNNSQTEFQTAYEQLDPEVRTVVDARFKQANSAAMRAEARETRRSIFEDMENYPYYTGDLRAKMDTIIDGESLENQTNPVLIKNAYKIVVADHMKEIQEGKVKSRLSQISGNTTQTPIVNDPNAMPSLSDEEKRQAKAFGVTEADWAKSKKELISEGVIGL